SYQGSSEGARAATEFQSRSPSRTGGNQMTAASRFLVSWFPDSSALFASFAGLLYPTLVEIDQVRNALNVLPISDAHLLFPLFQSRGHEIAPAEFGNKPIPDQDV